MAFGATLIGVLAGGAVEATVVDVQLTSMAVYGSSKRLLDISASTATWQYDDVADTLTQTGGTFDATLRLSPATTVYRHVITDLTLGIGIVDASSFACVEGNYGALLNRSTCGGYTFGANFTNESTATWGPGTAFSLVLGGDDAVNAAPFTAQLYDGFRTKSWDGTILAYGNDGCFAGANCTGLPDGSNGGYRFTLQAVPIPAAAWLFGGSLGLLGATRRRRTR